jgi:lipopolysaccharide biosynthesis protein
MVLGSDVAILCHYDRDGSVRPDTLRYLTELRRANFSTVVVSNSGQLTPDSLASLRGVADVVLPRRNIGLDFGAWRMAMRALGLPHPDTRRILLTNDSVYGPVVPLAPLLSRMAPEAADLWGLTDSQERGWHLQSYFLLAGPGLVHSDVWRRFWRGVVPLPFKRWFVWQYEIGLSRRVTQAGFRCRALFPHATVISNGEVANPVLEAWRPLLAAGFPFLKRELLRDNPAGVRDLGTCRDVVSPEYMAEIDADLRRR